MRIIERIRAKARELAERHLSGHVTIGPLTLFGANAMDWAVQIYVAALGVSLCAKPTTSRRGWYFYATPNCTPWAAVLGCGPGLGRENGERIAQRLGVLAESPRPETEAEKLWMLWGPKPAPARDGGEGGGGQRSVFNPSTGPFETAVAERLRRFTYDPSRSIGDA
jgi:hypothetical protein